MKTKTEVIISRAKDHEMLYTRTKVCEWLDIDEPTLNLWIKQRVIIPEDTTLSISLFSFESITQAAREKNKYEVFLRNYLRGIYKIHHQN